MKFYILMSEGCQCCSSTFGYYLTEQEAIKDKNQIIKDGYQNAAIEEAFICDFDIWKKQHCIPASIGLWHIQPEAFGVSRDESEAFLNEQAGA
jgi:hypothetical protein